MGIWIGERISTEDHADSTTLIIYPKLEMWKIWLLGIWVGGFTFIGVVMMYLLAGGIYSLEVVADDVEDVRDQQLVYLIVFLGFWFYFEFKTVKSLLWYRFGREYIKLDRDSLTHKRAILGYGKSVRFFYDNMKNVHQIKPETTSFGHFFENAYWSLGTDAIGFTYFNKEKSFGRRLDEKTGKLLLRFIDDKVKTLRKKK